MTRLTRSATAFLLALAAASAVLVAQAVNLQDTMPFDAAVRTATLAAQLEMGSFLDRRCGALSVADSIASQVCA